MHPNKGYDLAMRRLIMSAAVMLAMALVAPVSRAQVSGAVTPNWPQNKGPVPGMPLGHAGVMPTPMGVSPAPGRAFPTPTPIGVPPTLPFPGSNVGFGNHHHHRHPNGLFGGAIPLFVPVPVIVDPSSMYQEPVDPDAQQEEDQSVVPGPTVFERRTPADMGAAAGAAAMAADPAPPSSDASPAQAQTASASQPAQPQDSSVLVFRDGHQLEIQNYAIVGDTLYDFTPGHMRKVPLSQLDLPATQKANDDRGVAFTLPASSGNR